LLLPHHVERGAAVARLVDIAEAELLQQIADDPDHRLVIVDDQHRHPGIYSHDFLSAPSELTHSASAPRGALDPSLVRPTLRDARFEGHAPRKGPTGGE
jgi:hypothetical protein